MYNGYNIDKNDPLTQVEFSIFFSLDYKGHDDADDLFAACDYNHDHYLSPEEFIHCYCYGYIANGGGDDGDGGGGGDGDNGGDGGGDNGGGGGGSDHGGNDEVCTAEAIEYFKHYDTSNEYALDITEFAQFYYEYLKEEGKKVIDYFTIYDKDFDDYFSVDEFIYLYCEEIKIPDGGGTTVNTNCPADKEFDYDICQCVKK